MLLAPHPCRQSLAKAGESDAGVISRMNEHEGGFKDLAIDAAALRMPRLQVCEGHVNHGWLAVAVLPWCCCGSTCAVSDELDWALAWGSVR
jgi:hypothetical protein